MNWRLKLVLAFTNLRKPIDGEGEDIRDVRKKSETAAWLGTKFFDKHFAVAKVTNLTIENVPICIYSNSEERNQRVIIYYHGGGFVLYHLDSHDNVCRRLCTMNNCIVVSVDYRLAPEHTFPAAHEDAFAAIQWVRKNINSYDGNPDDLIVAGDSAGGNLSACMAHRCKKENIKLNAQVLIYPWVDGKLNNPSIERNGAGYLLTKESMFWFQKQYTPRPEDHCHPAVSPAYESDFTALAPAFILTAELDPLLDDGFKYYNQLKSAGNNIRYQEYPGLVHGFFSIPKVDRQAMQAFYDIKEFLSTIKP
jgi:acetyl esterase